MHQFYVTQGEQYAQGKLMHAMAALREACGISLKKASPAVLRALLEQSILTREWMVESIYQSRAKDYKNPFRKNGLRKQRGHGKSARQTE